MTKSESKSVRVFTGKKYVDVIVTVRQVADGEKIQYQGRKSPEKRSITINRVFHVIFDGRVIGSIAYKMFTRESRSKGARYVNARWSSPGWTYTTREMRDVYDFGWPTYDLAYGGKSGAVQHIVEHHIRGEF